jgi:hypothetical protein
MESHHKKILNPKSSKDSGLAMRLTDCYWTICRQPIILKIQNRFIQYP